MTKKSGIFKIILLLPFFAVVQTGWAEGYLTDAGAKFGRGIENVVTSPAEIPCTMENEMKKGDRILRFFSGLGVGSVYFLRRAVVGATEIVTFMVPMERTISRVCEEEPVGVIG